MRILVIFIDQVSQLAVIRTKSFTRNVYPGSIFVDSLGTPYSLTKHPQISNQTH